MSARAPLSRKHRDTLIAMVEGDGHAVLSDELEQRMRKRQHVTLAKDTLQAITRTNGRDDVQMPGFRRIRIYRLTKHGANVARQLSRKRRLELVALEAMRDAFAATFPIGTAVSVIMVEGTPQAYLTADVAEDADVIATGRVVQGEGRSVTVLIDGNGTMVPGAIER